MRTFIKNIKGIALGLAVLGMAIGFSAFVRAHSFEKAKVQNIYYPVDDGAGGFTWEIINPNDYECVDGNAGCSGYMAETAPDDNHLPDGYSNDGKVRRLAP